MRPQYLAQFNPDRLLYLSLGLLFVPVCIVMVYLLVTQPVNAPPPVAFTQVDRWVEPVAGYTFDHDGFAALMHQPPDFSKARWQSVNLPDVIPLPPISETSQQPEMARAWFRIRYTPSAQVDTGMPMGLYGTRVMGGAYSVWVQGRIIHTSLDNWRMQWNEPLLARLPADSLQPGKALDIYLAVPYRLAQGYAVGSLSVGAMSALRPIHDRRQFFQTSLPQGGILVALLLGLLSFQFWLTKRTDLPHLLMALTAVTWAVFNLQFLMDFSDNETVAAWYGSLIDAAGSWLILLIYFFAAHFHHRRHRLVEYALVIYALGMLIMTLPLWQWGVTALALQHYVNILVAAGICLYVTYLAWQENGPELKFIALALWLLPILGLHDIYYMSSQRAPDRIWVFQYATFFLFGAFLYSLNRRYLRAQDQIHSLNLSLEQRLQDREAELEAKHQELRAIEHRQALMDERQRLMRDMHDGIGSALMTTLVMAEQGQMPPDKMAGTLRDCVDELKLVIDSLEPIGHDLGTLLGMLRYRLAPRLEAAGIRVIWAVDDVPGLDWLEPPQALQVLRILQEALTNILKHAQASEVRISARQIDDNQGSAGILVEIADNGLGFHPDTDPRGRGIHNMRERARQLGATVDIQGVPGQGARVRLWLPLASMPVTAA